MDRVSKAFTDQNKKRIEEAVAKAEAGSFGEVVPCVVAQSSQYEEASAKAFLYSVMGMAILLMIYESQKDIWLPKSTLAVPILVTSILLITGLFFYFFIHFIPPIKRKLLGSRRMMVATARHAKVMFLENEVFQTKNRTGILIFISLFEHQVHVIADKGFAGRVSQDQWNEVVNIIVSGIKHGRPSDGIVEGIEKCGEILRKFSPKKDSDSDTDELKNHLNIGQSQ